MPNWVKNVMTVSFPKDSVESPHAFWNFVAGEEGGVFSLRSIVPRPKELDVEESSRKDSSVCAALYCLSDACIRGWPSNTIEGVKLSEAQKAKAEAVLKGLSEEERAELLELGLKYIHNYVLYGSWTWYDWSLKHWGTKWEVVDVEVGKKGKDGLPSAIVFDTAWSCPKQAMLALSEKFPEATIMIEYADEDIGNNCGIVCWNEGCEQNIEVDDSVAFARKIWCLDDFEDEWM